MIRASWLIPAYDAAATLDACLRSVARQTDPRFECVVVDDGSRDDTAARVEALADARFRVLRRPHLGLVAALEAGLDACRAPIVLRLDADDLAHRDRLAAQCDALDADPSLTAVASRVRLFGGSGRAEYQRWLNAMRTPEDVARERFIECPVAHPALALRREAFTQHRYRDCGWPEDWDLVLRLLGAGARIGVVPRRLLAWRDRPERLSRSASAYSLDAFTACRAHHLALGPLAAQGRYLLWGYGGTGKALRRALAAHGKEPAAIVELHPGRLGQRIFGAPVVPPDALRNAELVAGRPLLVSVAGLEARTLIRAALAGLGFDESRDYFVCA